jgi:O-antigen biosynthesis protein
MNRHESQARPPVLVIGGMHRSTTSLAASILTAAGLHLGDDLMGAGTGNEAGHFEDNDFYMLHQRILAANGLSLEGYTSAERIDVPATARDEAVAVLARRRAAGRPWGWKDPRTVLFLDFWADLLPEARWLFVVRPPWDVVDSLFRRGDTAFRANPRFAAEVWVAYNRRILDFVHTRPDHTVVVTAADVITDHAGFVRRASDLLGMPLETPASQFRPDLYAAGQPPHRAGLVRGAAPEAYELYRSLAELAGAQRQGLDHCGSPPRLADVAAAGLIEWNKACQAIAERGGFSAQVTEARQAVETASQELAAERDTVVRTQAHVDELTRDLVTERAARAEVTAYAESFTAQLAAAQADLARAQAESEARRLEVEARLAVSDREWSARLASERARRESETDQLTAALAEARASVESLTREAAARAADHDSAIEQLEIERDAARTELAAERESFETTLKADRDALTAQLDAERGIYESLRQDLTGRIEVARSSRRKAG